MVIEDQDGYEIRYAHLSSRSVSTGQQIEKGEEIGKVGSTGNLTGPHLHLELFHNGRNLNPLFILKLVIRCRVVMWIIFVRSCEKTGTVCPAVPEGVPYVWGGYSPRVGLTVRDLLATV